MAVDANRTQQADTCAWRCPTCPTHHENACPSLWGGILTNAPCGHGTTTPLHPAPTPVSAAVPATAPNGTPRA